MAKSSPRIATRTDTTRLTPGRRMSIGHNFSLGPSGSAGRELPTQKKKKQLPANALVQQLKGVSRGCRFASERNEIWIRSQVHADYISTFSRYETISGTRRRQRLSAFRSPSWSLSVRRCRRIEPETLNTIFNPSYAAPALTSWSKLIGVSSIVCPICGCGRPLY